MKHTIDALKEKLGSAIIETSDFRGDETAVLTRETLIAACRFLRDECGFTMLMDLCAVDYPARTPRFEVVYHLYAMEQGKRLRLKVRVSENDCHVPSVRGLWRAADWFEREAYDLFGVTFDGHPNMKRLLTFEGFEGHPLRKDYKKEQRQDIPTPDPLISGHRHD
jgi:NADH-quinone oxidoreductase subunit C